MLSKLGRQCTLTPIASSKLYIRPSGKKNTFRVPFISVTTVSR